MKGLLSGRGNNIGDVATDKTQPVWIRLGAGLLYLAGQLIVINLFLSKFDWFNRPGHQIFVVLTLVVNIIVWLSLTIIGFQVLRQSAAAKGIHTAQMVWRYVAGTFLYFLFPCMLLTVIVVAWAILTHQPGFSSY